VDPTEAEKVAEAARQLQLTHIVVTSVTRDDLTNGGAEQFANVIHTLRHRLPETSVEVLTPDFQGKQEAWDIVLRAMPDVFNHNIETVPSLYTEVRPEADYQRSLALLRYAAQRGKLHVKSGLMLGLGEDMEEVKQVARDLREAGVTMITVGQYLCPRNGEQLPVKRFIPPEEFELLKDYLAQLGFSSVACHPFARSSYQATITAKEIHHV